MKRTLFLIIIVTCSVLMFTPVIWAAEDNTPSTISTSSSSLTYEGYLESADGTPINGTIKFSSTLYDALTGGNQIGITNLFDDVLVEDGVFSVDLSFGDNTFLGGDRWLDISIDDVPLTPRQRITPAPYALRGGGTNSIVTNDSLNANISAGVSNTIQNNAQSSGIYVGTSNIISDAQNAFISGGITNSISGGSASSSILAGNQNQIMGSAYAAIIAGVGNKISETSTHSIVGGGQKNIIDGISYNAVIGGGVGNHIYSAQALIYGGRNHTIQNSTNSSIIGGSTHSIVASDHSTIVGGYNHTLSGRSQSSTIGGGFRHVIDTSQYSAILNGYDNQLTDRASFSTILGGRDNSITEVSQYSAILSGRYNSMADQANYNVIPGGSGNSITSGDYSFAAGRNAKITHTGTFLWADSQNIPLASTRSNQALFRVTGGMIIATANDSAGRLTAGVSVPGGSGSWATLSDVNAKARFKEIDSADILASIAQMPIKTWSYKTQDNDVRHMGPTAQDFHAAFGLGENDTTINTVDADGIALAAIQALATENETLREQNTNLADRLTAIEAQVGSSTTSQLPLLMMALIAGMFILAAALVSVISRRPQQTS
ncbi:MAG: tail fiber domain-containing protein [Candidatus Promineifilaceae bacterium]